MLKLTSTLGHIATSVVAVAAIAFMAVAPMSAQQANAQSSTESQIEELERIIAELQSQLGGNDTAPSRTCPVDPSLIVAVPLKAGFNGVDARQVQVLMNYFHSNMGINTQVAASGAGSAGMETTYYGPATAAAVKRFQEHFRAEILTPNGLSVGTGIYGPSTSAHVQTLCLAAGLEEGDDDDDTPPADDDDDDDDDDNEMSDDEASLENYDVQGDPDNEDVQEGEEDLAVFSAEFDVEDGDVEVERVEVNFEAASTTPEDEPWELLDEVSLWSGDEEVGRVDASDEDNWEEVDSELSPSGTEAYQLRFTGLDLRFDDGDTAELTVAVTAQSNIDSDDLDQEFDVYIPEDGVRAVDGAGINQYTGATGSIGSDEYTTFGFEAEGEGEELTVSESSENPDEAVIRVEEEDTSDAYTLLAFTLEAEDNDIEVTEIPVDLTFSSSVTFDAVVSDAWLEIDGEEYNDYDNTNSTGATTTLTFDLSDEDFVVEDGEEVEVLFVVEFNEQEGNYSNGLTVEADVEADDIEAEGAEDLGSSDLSGSASGETQTLMAEGIFAEAVSTSADDEDTSTSAGGELGEYAITFDVTAFEGDFYLPKTAERYSVSGSSTSGVVYRMESGDSATTAGTTTDSITARSTVDSSGSYWVIRDGETETFQLQVSYQPAADGFFALQLVELHYNDSATTADTTYTATPEEDFETDEVNLDA